jgi:hypothetical protein
MKTVSILFFYEPSITTTYKSRLIRYLGTWTLITIFPTSEPHANIPWVGETMYTTHPGSLSGMNAGFLILVDLRTASGINLLKM